MILRPPRSTLFPCTTLCRSEPVDAAGVEHYPDDGDEQEQQLRLPPEHQPRRGDRRGEHVARPGEKTSVPPARQYFACGPLLDKKTTQQHPAVAYPTSSAYRL